MGSSGVCNRPHGLISDVTTTLAGYIYPEGSHFLQLLPLVQVMDDTKPLINNIIIDGGAANGQVSPDSSAISEQDKYHLDEIIPLEHDHRTIVLCFDGTGDQFSEDVRTAC